MLRKVLTAAVLALATSAAHAAQVTVESVTGYWDVVTEVGTPNTSGEGTSKILWGESFPGYNDRSGFAFDSLNETQSFNVNTAFDVGVFTHLNRVIYQGAHVDVARLNLTIKASFDGMVKTFTTAYDFSLWETPNLSDPCANGGANGGGGVNVNGCADRVQLLKNDSLNSTFEHDGKTYSFSLLGFDSGDEFWTIEDRNNSTYLKAIFNVTDDREDPPIVPLPAAGWLLIGALGGFLALRRSEKR